MLSSQTHNFTFLHIPRTAGWSITRALDPIATLKGLYHLTLSELLDMNGDLGERQILSVVRNPWERLHSLYYSKWNKGTAPFHDWLLTLKDLPLQNIFALSQVHWLVAPTREVDWVFRFERLAQDWDVFQYRFNTDYDLPRLHADGRLPRAERKPLTTESIDYIEEACQWEIQKYGYRRPS